MKILVAIPCLYGTEHTLEAVNSIVSADGILLIDNGAEEGVKNVINSFDRFSNVHVIRNEENIYVNPAWNQIISFFLNSDFDYLCIMNSDLIMQKDWSGVVARRWMEDPNEILIPKFTQDKELLAVNHNTSATLAKAVHEGTPGVFITLNKTQAKIVYPLPEVCKVWFGDEYIYTILRKLGYKTVIPNNLIAYHYWSQNVQKVQGISELIEQDKKNWEAFGRSAMLSVISNHNG